MSDYQQVILNEWGLGIISKDGNQGLGKAEGKSIAEVR
jgi:hypothetical protein